MLETQSITCPYCWQSVAIQIDLSAGDQDYVEDCSVCCQPIALRIRVGLDASLLDIEVARENE